LNLEADALFLLPDGAGLESHGRIVALKNFLRILLGLSLALVSSSAMAHPGHSGNHDVVSGFVHPFGGVDHIFAMLGVGIWAALRGQKAVWLWPLTFVAAMVLGGGLGLASAPFPSVEPMVLASTIIIGLAVVIGKDFSVVGTSFLIAIFGCAHGIAHGVEGSSASSPWQYAAGFTLATGALHIVGLFAGWGLKRASFKVIARWLGPKMAWNT
jgi:urease accessory protein